LLGWLVDSSAQDTVTGVRSFQTEAEPEPVH